MLHRSVPPKAGPPVRRARVVIEDLVLADAVLDQCETVGMEITICSGPRSEHEICPLVVDGTCPVGSCDVVVCGLDGPWAHSVEQAWQREGVLFARTAPDPSSPPTRRLDASVGEAVRMLFAAQYGTPGQEPAEVVAAETDVAFDGVVETPWVAASYGRRMFDTSAPRPTPG